MKILVRGSYALRGFLGKKMPKTDSLRQGVNPVINQMKPFIYGGYSVFWPSSGFIANSALRGFIA